MLTNAKIPAMPIRIIEQRAKESPCCGGSILRSGLIFGKGSVNPCTPTSTEQITNGTFTGGYAGWNLIDIGIGLNTYAATDRINWDAAAVSQIADGYFQPINLDSTKEYIFSVEKIDTGVDPPPTIIIAFQSIDGKYTFGTLTAVNGVLTGPIHPAAWVAGTYPFWASYFLGPTDYGVLLYWSEAGGATYGGGYIDNLSLTLEECI